MKKSYEHFINPTREILDNVKVGDLIKINDWKKPMRVKAVSENFFVMVSKQFKDTYYSVCSKLPWDGVRYNSMVGGRFHCGADDWIFGSPLTIEHKNVYSFENEETNRLYLQEFEDGKTHISERNGIAIFDVFIKEDGHNG